MRIPNELPDQIAHLYLLIEEVNRRARNRRRTGTVAEIDHEKGLYRIKLSEQGGRPYLTDWIQTRQLGAGSVKIDVLLKEGEQVDVLSENGDLTDAVIDLSTYSEHNPRENSSTPFLIKIGDASFALTGGELTQTAGTINLVGDVRIQGTIECNGVDISDTHKHDEVTPGTAETGTPV